ncbi:MAG TPA: homoserine dehydrogenase [Candidatus Avidesulfovibrio excrementigallinarum]|nr:homoserine dehydrogenase [Candidatus Avidesulfovibrio excrementigallinarum]
MNPLQKVTLGLAGFGTVGGGLVEILQKNKAELEARSGCRFELKTVVVRDPSRIRSVALPEGTRLSTSLADVTDDPDIDIAVELMGGIEPPRSFIHRALENGKHVVTANKALLAEAGEELFKLAERKGVRLLYEASVAGGIPVVQTLKESLAGNSILSVEGILNGTSNYILSEMSSNGKDFASALADAQAKGYAEADPSLDIDGHDTAHKLVLLIRLAFGVDYPYSQMPVQGIRNMNSMDIEFAREFGYRVKLLGRVRRTEDGLAAGVFPVLVRHTYLLARVGGAFNAIRIEGNAVGSLFLHGQGAGALPTGSAVMSDIVAAARGTMPFNTGFAAPLHTAAIVPPDDAVSPYYVRFMIKDQPGVLHALTGDLAEFGVSIAQAIQKGERDDGVPLVLMLHAARVQDVQNALNKIAARDFLNAPAIAYRVMD